MSLTDVSVEILAADRYPELFHQSVPFDAPAEKVRPALGGSLKIDYGVLAAFAEAYLILNG